MPFKDHTPIPKKEKISVSFLVEKLRERVKLDVNPLAAESVCDNRFVTDTDLHRPGLALAGYIELFTYQRIQIIGNTESQYLEHLGRTEQKKSFGNILRFDVPVIFLTDNNILPKPLLRMAEEAGSPCSRQPVLQHSLCTCFGIFWKINLPFKQWYMGPWSMYTELEY